MKRRTALTTLAVAAALGLTACGGGDDPLAAESSSSDGGGSGGGSVVVGGANFSESTLLAEIYAGALQADGIDASTKLNIGSREVYLRALQDNSIQVFPEYTGALALYYDADYSGTDADEVYAHVQEVIPDDVTVLEKSAAEDNDSINVTQETADKYSLSTISDLADVAGDLTLAAPPEFKERPQGVPGLKKTYGVTFGSFRPLTGQAIVQALVNGQADAANIFSTDPAIAANDFVTLEDDQKLFGSQNIVPLVRSDRADEVKDTLDAVSAKLTTDAVADMLKQTDIDKKDPAEVAQQFLSDNGLS
ncbi:ABC transporter substrate-binding protein [Phycicoccus endophyticus]|uniref:ABC transporter substrate-binding protein n=1 Tax=Phycicoccus endophyticus TaxID=1690220 RepID=A0A7G9R1H3_9MICO|nr:ABC transporter substrate-binding protein [Phycicoccus endophyticus]NHI18764.1 ABC transporter substrate-binding protein [Phycicoccus endophyticus]QNN49448.1 ABC transporter substrate-binding protein [Phycicoccus endophyticus]GGL36721.1 glycine/betaine ABC transporter substrate-binding protein [Phycicoccus endophyticus]